MAEGVTVANAFVQIMPSAEGAQQNITEALLPQMEGAGQSAGGSLGSSMFGAFKGIFGPLMAAFGAEEIVQMAIEWGIEFEEATKTLVVGTGAAGESLAELQGTMKNVYSDINMSMGDVADIIQDLNTRFGIQGNVLEGVAEQVAALGNLYGSGINLDTLTGSFNRWGVQAEDMGRTLDNLFVIGQKTGASFDTITGALENNQFVLSEIGLSYEEAAYFVGELDRSGLNANKMLRSMQGNLGELYKYGDSAAEGLRNVVSQITDLSSQGEDGREAALALAESIWGKQNASSIVTACENGVFSLEDLDEALGNTKGAIMDTYEMTETLPDQWGTLWNTIKSTTADETSAITGMIGDGLENITSFIRDAGGINVQNVIPQLFRQAKQNVKTGIEAIKGIFNDLVDFVRGIPGKIAGFFSGIGDRIKSAFASVGSTIKNAIKNALTLSGSLTIAGKSIEMGAFRWFADGGIVNAPTVFSGFGAGEAGPEAIIPLRGSSMDNLAQSIADKNASHERGVVTWLSTNLPRIIEDYTPTMTKREFSRAVSSVV